MPATESLRYRRVLLKLSGEALMGERPFGLEPEVIERIAGEKLIEKAQGSGEFYMDGSGQWQR